jgi:hypothetical protein
MARSAILDLQSAILDPRSSFLCGSYLCIRIRRQAEAFSFFLPYFLWKRSTRPAVSTSFCLPVKNGWQFEQIST